MWNLERNRMGSKLPTLAFISAAVLGCQPDDSPAQAEQRQADPLRAAAEASVRHLATHAELFGLRRPEDLRVHSIISDDARGVRHARVSQTLDGIPVFGGDAVVHVSDGGNVLKVTDGFVPRLKARTRPAISEDEAIRLALQALPCPDCVTAKPRAALYILRHRGTDHLTYKVDFRIHDGTHRTSRPIVFIDAEDGALVWQYNNLQTATGSSLYDGTVTFDSYSSSPSQFFLEDVGHRIGTFDYRNAYTRFPFEDADDGWSADSQRAGVQAQWAAGRVLAYYQNVHGRLGLDGEGGPGLEMAHDGVTSLITSGVHYGVSFDNAYWDGSSITYGDGNGTTLMPLVTLDICGHELTHGVTEFTANLIYSGESGALNEATSDIFAAMIERYARGGVEDERTWMVGEDCYTPATPGDALRYMDEPHRAENAGYTADDDPDHYTERYTGSRDNGGVHLNSGIANKAFYLMAKGGGHHLNPGVTIDPADAPVGTNERALGPDKAARIWYRALTQHWTSSTSFRQGARGLFDAAEALYGVASDEAKTVKKAWMMVGVPIDRVPPTVSMTAPAAGTTVGGTTTVTVAASDDVGVTAVELYVDGQLRATDAAAPYQFEWQTFTDGNGAHTLTARAYDTSGNIGTSEGVPVTVDNEQQPPVVAISSPVNGATVSGVVPVTVSATDNIGVTRVELRVDGVLVGTDTESPWELTWSALDTTDGQHQIVARAYDNAGNSADSPAITLLVSNPFGAVYDSALKAPRCSAVQSSCDSKNLLNGRGSVGPEANAPNTIASSCADGTSGRYHADESLDRLRVSTLDGSPFAPGKTVRVEATVWVYSAASDSLDLFYAPDANNPVWSLIGTSKAAATGQQQLVATYVLPAGNVQAIRASWRYLGSTATCPYGDYNDRDDLVFAVSSNDVTPPQVSIISPVSGARVRGTVPVGVSAIDDVGVSSVELLADGVVVASSTTAPFALSWNTSTAADGAHQLVARARDASGKTGTSAAVDVNVDNTAPVVIVTAPADGAAVTGSVAVTVDASDGASGVTEVELLVDGQVQATDTAAPYSFSWDASVVAAGPHSLSARARDGAGNQATASVSVTVSGVVDPTPPAVAITSPANGANLVGVVTVTVAASDNVGVTTVELLVDGAAVASSTTPPFSLAWNSGSATDGAHVLQARAWDAARNNATSAEVTVTSDNTPPTTAITAPPPGALLRGTVTVDAEAGDNIGIAAVDLLVDGALWATDAEAPYSFSLDTLAGVSSAWTIEEISAPVPFAYAAVPGLMDGVRQLQTRARDVSGNTSMGAPVAVTVDNTAPTVSITAPSNGTSVSGTVTVTASASDASSGVASVEFSLDGVVQATDTSSPYQWSWNTAGASAGTHSLVATARDQAGNDTVSSSVAVNVLSVGTGLTGEYYDNRDFSSLKLTRVDPTVNFDWQSSSPASSIGVDTFSVRWTGAVRARYTETYTFYTTSDDGIRLWVNGQQLVDNWTDHAAVESSGTIALNAGQLYDIKVDYYENGGNAVAKLSWSSASQAKEIIPTAQLYPASGAGGSGGSGSGGSGSGGSGSGGSGSGGSGSGGSGSGGSGSGGSGSGGSGSGGSGSGGSGSGGSGSGGSGSGGSGSGGSGSGGSGSGGSGGTTAGLKVQYRAADTNATDNQIKPHFNIVNTGSSAVPLSELTIRYWYTNEGGVAQTANCDYAVAQCTNVTRTAVPVSPARAGADTYLEVGFSSAAAGLPAGGQSGEIQLRVNKSNWSNYNEANDYSFDPSKTAFADWAKVTLYRNGTLVWGTEP